MTGFPVGERSAKSTFTVAFGFTLLLWLSLLQNPELPLVFDAFKAHGLLAIVEKELVAKGEAPRIAREPGPFSSPATSKLVPSSNPTKLNFPLSFGNSRRVPNSSLMEIVLGMNCKYKLKVLDLHITSSYFVTFVIHTLKYRPNRSAVTVDLLIFISSRYK